MSSLFARRYILGDPIGEGGMGIVYRATDRLTGETVALKRVLAPLNTLIFDTMSNSFDQRLAMTQEFQLLASLRHPHIISVLDYGFDAENQPFFTMPYLEHPRTILEAGDDEPLEGKIRLLIQTLQALTYLHRRGILHRDLKPGNILVQNGQVKILDFGLAVRFNEATNRMAGTVAYMAPEVLEGKPATPAADLYAIGLVAYELLAGHFPFNTASVSGLLMEVLQTEPDLTPLVAATGNGSGRPAVSEQDKDMPGSLPLIVGKLLSKKPDNRFASAEAVTQALSRAINRPPPEETIAIRESFLQAATFVGRDTELHQLEKALHNALDGQGSAWLVGGESGVGKSRLIDELRTRALVRGALVLQGQGRAEVTVSYNFWRNPLRLLSLSADISDTDAAILQEIVPDIAALRGRLLPSLPATDEQAAQKRLLDTIISVFRHFPQPMLLILEDLQWSAESLTVLQRLLGIVKTLPLLIIGSYRREERPDLPDVVPEMQVIQLERLTSVHIADLSYAMLGEAGRNSQLVALLQRETEGNVFFVVEVVRALAEEAGRLGDIASMTLPMHVFAGGIQEVVHRRLSRAPAWGQSLLALAAITGRELDLSVLRQIVQTAPIEVGLAEHSLDDWLLACANAVVLEVRGEHWRFAHDKLRDGVLAALAPASLPGLHRQVAIALETIYGDQPEYAALLAMHWHAAQNPAKEGHYAAIAGQQAMGLSQFRRAIGYFERALELLPPADSVRRLALQCRLADGHTFLSNHTQAIQLYTDSLHLARSLEQLPFVATALRGLANVDTQQGRYHEAIERYTESLAICRKLHDQPGEADSLNGLGSVYRVRGQVDQAIHYFDEALQIAQATGDTRGSLKQLISLGNAYLAIGQANEAIAYYLEVLPLAREVGERHRESALLGNLGLAYLTLGQVERAIDSYRQAIPIAQDIGDRVAESNHTGNLGLAYLILGESAIAIQHYRHGLSIAQAIGHKEFEVGGLVNLSILYLDVGETDEAVATGQAALALANEIQNPVWQCYAGISLGWALLAANRDSDGRLILQGAAELKAPDQIRQKAIAALGVACLRVGDETAALHAFRQAAEQATNLLAKVSDFYEAWYTLGLAQAGLALLGQLALEESASTYRKGRELAPQRGVLADARRQVDALAVTGRDDLALIRTILS